MSSSSLRRLTIPHSIRTKIHQTSHYRSAKYAQLTLIIHPIINRHSFASQSKQSNVGSKDDKSTSMAATNPALSIMSDHILDSVKDESQMNEEEKHVYKVVNQLLNDGFLDDPYLLTKAQKSRDDLIERREDQINTIMKESLQPDDVADRMEHIDDHRIITNHCLSKPLEFRINPRRRNRGDKSGDFDISFSISLDDRDVKHILIKLLSDSLSQRQNYRNFWSNLHPAVQQLAALYGINKPSDFRRVIARMTLAHSELIKTVRDGEPQRTYIPPHVLATHDPLPQQASQLLGEEYDEYGQRKDALTRPMTEGELTRTIKRMQDLEYRMEHIKSGEPRRRFGGNDDDEDKKGAFDEVVDRISQRWQNKLLDETYVGGDWRVRLGIADRPPRVVDTKTEVEKQWNTQLRDDFVYTARRKYAMSPFKIRSLPVDEANQLNIDFRNVKFLNNFVNSRGMILPRRLTGMNLKHQKKIARAIKRARANGLMPHMTKLLILDKEKIKAMREEYLIAKERYDNRDDNDPMTIEDLRKMYPEYAPTDDEYDQLQKQMAEDEEREADVLDLKQEYGIDDDELVYAERVTENDIFLRSIKQDIMTQLPEYWIKRLQFREKVEKKEREEKQRQTTKQRSDEQWKLRRKLPEM